MIRRSALCLMAIVASAVAQEPPEVMITAERIPWAEEAAGQPQRLGSLWGRRSGGPAGTLLRVPAGFVAPVHTHTADYRAVVIEGRWRHWYTQNKSDEAPPLAPGSYWTQTANIWHADACVSDTPCIILLINEDPYKTIVKTP
jgi:quercetin dioxygenase-like cupin family protein